MVEKQPEQMTMNQQLTELESRMSALLSKVDKMEKNIEVLKEENNILSNIIETITNNLNENI